MTDNGAFKTHFNENTGEYQTNQAHLTRTAELAQKRNRLPELDNIVHLAALLHDVGKYSDAWQEYFLKSVKDEPGGEKLDHATAGGQAARELMGGSPASVMIQTAIYSHHGLCDCYSLYDDTFLLDKRNNKAASLPIAECTENFYNEFNKEDIKKLAELADADARALCVRIKEKIKEWGGEKNAYGNSRFYLGMYQKLLMSLLIDADRRDTEDFAFGRDIGCTVEDTARLWEECEKTLENMLAGFKADSDINRRRSEISLMCKNAADQSCGRYLLTVPTGAGKTLSSLRFAISHAKKFNKSRIIYVAPFQSIVEQNAHEIREALGHPGVVLEHHCNIIIEDEEQQMKYDRITEDWQFPVIVTTAVQFLNTIFSAKTGCLRRMHSLCDSVIIIDEVQALPINITELFNMAVNFFSEFAGTDFVLCTATQPRLSELKKNNLLFAGQMAGDPKQYEQAFKRVDIDDDTGIIPAGMSIEDAALYISEKAEKYGSVLFIANTKSCAEKIYQRVAQLKGGEFEVSHLSTNMYPEHRRQVIKSLKKNTDKKRICISTQIVEAGVNISFKCVIRSFAGLDSIIQAAGRCNRNGEYDRGNVFVVRMNSEAENLSHLKDIRLAQQAMIDVQMYIKDKNRDMSLDSPEAIELYFNRYYESRKNELDYPVTINGTATGILDMLSENKKFCQEKHKPMLVQAFKTAGEEFEVIADAGKITLVVETKETTEKLAMLEDIKTDGKDKRRILRELQSYTVSVSGYQKDKLAGGIRTIMNGQIAVLDERFYNEKIGVTYEPKPMAFINL
ncbi:MAG: CRISPR-associated helicase Cas3' [Eubacterium sp.]|nr:CRISPR-associated helicase Cas3' [Eubacterium sp.]